MKLHLITTLVFLGLFAARDRQVEAASAQVSFQLHGMKKTVSGAT